jgi:hypothetical protein
MLANDVLANSPANRGRQPNQPPTTDSRDSGRQPGCVGQQIPANSRTLDQHRGRRWDVLGNSPANPDADVAVGHGHPTNTASAVGPCWATAWPTAKRMRLLLGIR